MTMDRIVLIGAGGHAAACIDVIEAEGRFEIVGLIGKADEAGTSVLGYPVLGTDADLPALVHEVDTALVTVGQIKSPTVRVRLFDAACAAGFTMTTIISPRAHVSRHARLGAGTIVMHGAVVNADATVGRNCIINSLALVEHGAMVGDHCHIATNAALNSSVRIGDGTFIGSGSTVRQGISIGRDCVIGMGQRVLKDCPDSGRLP